MILDLTDLPFIDVTVGLVIENAVKDAKDVNCDVFVMCPNEQTSQQLSKFDVLRLVSEENTFLYRDEALQKTLDIK
tara:strand:+ start:144 stop:371 length:228 start_codon:yes stop_codon:yes gene_type:complete